MAEDVEITEVVDAEIIAIPNNRYDNQERGPGHGQGQRDSNYSRGRGNDNSYQKDEEDSGMEMTRITVTETIRIEIMIVKVILIGVDDGIIIVEVKDIVIVEEVDYGIPISSIMIQGTTRNPNFKTQITTDHLQWDINTYTQSHMVNIHTSPSNNSTRHKCQPPSQQAANICQLCYSQGHYNYQCQLAGDFMARTQKAFNPRQII